MSYAKRVADVNRIYDEWSRSGLPNREIWRRYIWPVLGISERTFYNILKVEPEPIKQMQEEGFLFKDFFDKEDECRRRDYYKKNP